jgi:hypothetical protein
MTATAAPRPRDADRDSRDDLVSVARGGALNVVGTIMNGLSGFLLGIIVTRGLHARGAGVFFETVALFMITTTVAQVGADIGVVREIPRHRALGRFRDAIRGLYVALAPVVVVATVIGVAMCVYAPEISHLIIRGGDHDAAVPYLRVLGPFLPLAAVSKVLLSATRSFGTMLPFVAIEYFGKGAVRPVLALVVVALGLGSVGVGAAAAVLFAVNVTAALPATPSNIGVFQAACVAVLSAYGVGHTDALAYGIILQAVEIATAFALGMPALVREGMSWKDLRLRALHSSPVELAVTRRAREVEAEA